jgi:predicted DCC family thiol-disulfide oxidoreductase YuxK
VPACDDRPVEVGTQALSATLLFDGDCGFCTRAAHLAERINPGVAVLAWQRADLVALGVSEAQAAAALQYVSGDRVGDGSDAVAFFLLDSGRLLGLVGRTLLLPGVRGAAQAGYRIVAANRHRLPGGTPACAISPGPDAR